MRRATEILLIVAVLPLVGCGLKTECVSGERQCDGMMIQFCSGGRFESEACPQGQMCMTTMNRAACMPTDCTEGSTQCDSGTNIQVCETGSWASSVTCPDSQMCMDMGGTDSCAAMGAAGECTDAATQCEGLNQIWTCDSGAWGAPASCLDGKICMDMGGAAMCMTPVCTENSTQCDGSASIQVCTMGAWASSVTCPDSQMCMDKGGTDTCAAMMPPGDCTNNATKCEGTSLIWTCDSGAWGAPASCPDGKSCSDMGGTAMCMT